MPCLLKIFLSNYNALLTFNIIFDVVRIFNEATAYYEIPSVIDCHLQCVQ